ncbi:MAG: hypothetical protein ACUVSW_06460 [Roseiflexus sp.]
MGRNAAIDAADVRTALPGNADIVAVGAMVRQTMVRQDGGSLL